MTMAAPRKGSVQKENATSKPGKRQSAPERAAPFVPPLTISNRELLQKNSDSSFREFIYLIVDVLGKLSTCREAFGRSMDLTGSQFAVLVGVAYRQETKGVTIKRLSEYVHLAATHVTTEVGRLQRKGLLTKRPGTDDRRSVMVTLTPEGEAAVMQVSSFVRRVNDLLFSGIKAADLKIARAMFTRLSLNSELALAELKIFERENQPSGF
jgi:DNA-binding MarR family transcriptional regulator